MSGGRRYLGPPRQFAPRGADNRGEEASRDGSAPPSGRGNQTRTADTQDSEGEAASPPFLPSAKAANAYLEARARAKEHERRGSVGLDSLQYLRASDVCRLLRISKPTLWRLRRTRGFPEPTEVTDRLIAWRRSEVEEWLERVASGRKVPLTAPTPRTSVTETAAPRALTTLAKPPTSRRSRKRSRPQPPEEQLALPLKIVS